MGQVPQKGAFYRGAQDELVESARLGTNTADIPQSKTILTPQFEGANVVLQSKSSLSTRDRRIVKAQVGGGLVTTETLYKVLPYNESGRYNIVSFKNNPQIKKTIVPGSLKVNIDGEDIDSTDFTFFTPTGALNFNRDDLLDPTSIISVSYQVRTKPDGGVTEIEALPKNNFGKLEYGSVTVSPTDWISPQVGYAHLDDDSSHRHDLVNISSPSEIRTASSSLFLKFDPEFTYDAETKAKAAALSLQSRFGEKLSFLFNGLLPDSNYVSTDNLDRGYGFIRHSTDYTVGYDIRKELPLSYNQNDIVSAHGTERHYEFTAGSHFQGFPFLDISLSRNAVTTDRNDTLHTVRDTIRDSLNPIVIDTIINHYAPSDSITYALDRNKDKFRVRLYETSSPIIESALHLKRVNYAGFSSSKEGIIGTGYGSIFYGRGTVSPIKRLTLTVQGTYLKNAPGSVYGSEYNPNFILQTIDAPPGFEIYASSGLDFKNLYDYDSSFNTLQRVVNLTIKPGAWSNIMSWIQPVIGLNQSISCGFNNHAPGLADLLFPQDNITNKVTTPDIGANIFPTNEITINDDNKFTTTDSTTIYSSFNDLKWWFGDKRFWQTRWEYNRERPRGGTGNGRDYSQGFTRFTDNWTPWLQTRSGFSSYITVTNSDSTSSIKTGPDLTVSINTQKFLFVRSFLCNNTVSVLWNKNYGAWQSSPSISYSLFTRIVVLPNISVMTTNLFTFGGGTSTQYSGNITASAVF